MPHKLKAALERHIPHIRITSAERPTLEIKDKTIEGPTIHIRGHMADLPKGISRFNITYFEHPEGGFHAVVTCPTTKKSAEVLGRFKGAFGEGSNRPKMFYTNKRDSESGYEFWSDSIHADMAPSREQLHDMQGHPYAKKYS